MLFRSRRFFDQIIAAIIIIIIDQLTSLLLSRAKENFEKQLFGVDCNWRLLGSYVLSMYEGVRIAPSLTRAAFHPPSTNMRVSLAGVKSLHSARNVRCA